MQMHPKQQFHHVKMIIKQLKKIERKPTKINRGKTPMNLITDMLVLLITVEDFGE